MNSLLYLIIQIINLFQFVLIIYIVLTWLVNFNVINTGNRFVYSILDTLYRLCEPSLNFVRRYLPTFGGIDLSPIVVFLGLWFIKSLLIEYWPKQSCHLYQMKKKDQCLRCFHSQLLSQSSTVIEEFQLEQSDNLQIPLR